MYFFTNQGTVCHILEDKVTGKAPAPCGAQVNRLALIALREGKPSQIVAEKPADKPLCKHCEKSEE